MGYMYTFLDARLADRKGARTIAGSSSRALMMGFLNHMGRGAEATTARNNTELSVMVHRVIQEYHNSPALFAQYGEPLFELPPSDPAQIARRDRESVAAAATAGAVVTPAATVAAPTVHVTSMNGAETLTAENNAAEEDVSMMDDNSAEKDDAVEPDDPMDEDVATNFVNGDVHVNGEALADGDVKMGDSNTFHNRASDTDYVNGTQAAKPTKKYKNNTTNAKRRGGKKAKAPKRPRPKKAQEGDLSFVAALQCMKRAALKNHTTLENIRENLHKGDHTQILPVEADYELRYPYVEHRMLFYTEVEEYANLPPSNMFEQIVGTYPRHKVCEGRSKRTAISEHAQELVDSLVARILYHRFGNSLSHDEDLALVAFLPSLVEGEWHRLCTQLVNEILARIERSNTMQPERRSWVEIVVKSLFPLFDKQGNMLPFPKPITKAEQIRKSEIESWYR